MKCPDLKYKVGFRICRDIVFSQVLAKLWGKLHLFLFSAECFHWTLLNPFILLVNSKDHTGEFGACLLRLRTKRKLSQKAVAIAAHMDQSYLAGLEAGRRPPPRDRQLARLIDALNAIPEEIKELREARALSRLAEVVIELDPERGAALASLTRSFNRLSGSELHIIQEMALLLEQR